MSWVLLTLWLLALGAVSLYLFFFGIASVSPFETAGASVAVTALALLAAVRSARIRRELRDRAGDPQLHADRQRARERRGF